MIFLINSLTIAGVSSFIPTYLRIIAAKLSKSLHGYCGKQPVVPLLSESAFSASLFRKGENWNNSEARMIATKANVGIGLINYHFGSKEKLITVFNFLFEHSAILRISILGDFQNYTGNCNSVLTQQGFLLSFMDGISNEDKSMFVFILTAAMQVAFLGNGTIKQLFGYDFTKTEDRAAYIGKLVDFLSEGVVQIDK